MSGKHFWSLFVDFHLQKKGWGRKRCSVILRYFARRRCIDIKGTKTSVFYSMSSETVLQMRFQLFLPCWKNDISGLSGPFRGNILTVMFGDLIMAIMSYFWVSIGSQCEFDAPLITTLRIKHSALSHRAAVSPSCRNPRPCVFVFFFASSSPFVSCTLVSTVTTKQKRPSPPQSCSYSLPHIRGPCVALCSASSLLSCCIRPLCVLFRDSLSLSLSEFICSPF